MTVRSLQGRLILTVFLLISILCGIFCHDARFILFELDSVSVVLFSTAATILIFTVDALLDSLGDLGLLYDWLANLNFVAVFGLVALDLVLLVFLLFVFFVAFLEQALGVHTTFL